MEALAHTAEAADVDLEVAPEDAADMYSLPTELLSRILLDAAAGAGVTQEQVDASSSCAELVELVLAASGGDPTCAGGDCTAAEQAITLTMLWWALIGGLALVNPALLIVRHHHTRCSTWL